MSSPDSATREGQMEQETYLFHPFPTQKNRPQLSQTFQQSGPRHQL